MKRINKNWVLSNNTTLFQNNSLYRFRNLKDINKDIAITKEYNTYFVSGIANCGIFESLSEAFKFVKKHIQNNE